MTSRILTCTELKGHCLFVLVSGYVCARLSCILSFRVHVKLFYRIVSYRISFFWWWLAVASRYEKNLVVIDEFNCESYIWPNESIRCHKNVGYLTEVIDHEACTVAGRHSVSSRVVVCVTTKHKHEATQKNRGVEIARLMTWSQHSPTQTS